MREWKEAKEKGTDWWARGMAAIAIVGVVVVALLTIRQSSITQEQNVDVIRPETEVEAHNRRVQTEAQRLREENNGNDL